MIFDQYSRYKACADLLCQAGLVAGSSVLDIGSGPECLFGRFLPDAKMNYVDPLISADSSEGRIAGDVFSSVLDGLAFDCVTAVDVLEHVPPERRHAFLKRFASLGKNTLILGFPASDSPEALLVDESVDDQYRAVFGHKYSWLEEHYEYGLPSLVGTVEELKQLGWHCRTIGHGHAPWLTELLGFVICVWDVSGMRPLVQEISEEFNRKLYPHDFRPPFYRQFVVATRELLPILTAPRSTTDDKAADKIFLELMEDAHARYFSVSLKAMVAQEEKDTEYRKKLYEVSEWGSGLQALILQRNEQIASLELALSAKQTELMKMSDWAFGMKQALKERDAAVAVRCTSLLKRSALFARRKLAQTVLGDVIRYFRDIRRRRERQVSIEVLRQSLKDNHDRLIIVFPVITWDFRRQRPQQIVSRLRDHGYSVLYLAMTLTPQERRLRGYKDAIAGTHFNELDRHINQIWLSTSKQLNIYTDSLGGDDLHNIFTGLSAIVSELHPKSIKYLVQFPGWWPAVKKLKEQWGGNVIFDCMDDHGGFSTNTKQVLDMEDALIKDADLVITSADLLEQRAKKITPNVIQIKNGTEFEHFANPRRNGKLDYLSGHPIIGYYGAISDWFDMDIMACCAKKYPDWNFVLIGATFGADLEPIEGLKNVYLLGEKPYKELPGYFAYFDVCTIPFKIMPLTLATNPVKFYEYLSAGKPVVAVELPELAAYREDCYLAHNADEFSFLLEKALAERDDENKIARRIKLASENSWDSRVRDILESSKF